MTPRPLQPPHLPPSLTPFLAPSLNNAPGWRLRVRARVRARARSREQPQQQRQRQRQPVAGRRRGGPRGMPRRCACGSRSPSSRGGSRGSRSSSRVDSKPIASHTLTSLTYPTTPPLYVCVSVYLWRRQERRRIQVLKSSPLAAFGPRFDVAPTAAGPALLASFPLPRYRYICPPPPFPTLRPLQLP